MKGHRDGRARSVTSWLKGLLMGGKNETHQPEMIACEEAMAVLYDYLDNELTGMTHDRVKAHFDVCARCYPKLRMEESFRLAVRWATRGEKAPPILREELMAALARAQRASQH